jgi:hypothetical protein
MISLGFFSPESIFLVRFDESNFLLMPRCVYALIFATFCSALHFEHGNSQSRTFGAGGAQNLARLVLLVRCSAAILIRFGVALMLSL